MLVRLTSRERARVTGDLFTSTGLAATERAKRSVVNRVVGDMSGSEFRGNTRFDGGPVSLFYIPYGLTLPKAPQMAKLTRNRTYSPELC